MTSLTEPRADPGAVRRLWESVIGNGRIVFAAVAGRLASFRFSSLVARIIAFSSAGFIILIAGITYFSQYQAWLINAKRDSLLAQGEIIASAIAADSAGNVGRLVLDPQLLEPEGGAVIPDNADPLGDILFSIDPTQIAPLIQKIATSTGIRARVYDAKGEPILDSDTLTGEGTQPGRNAGRAKVSSFWLWLRRATNWSDLPVYRDIGRANGKAYAGVAAALSGNTTPLLMISEQGEHIVSVAVPVQRGGTMLGALMLSTRGGEIDDLIWTERKLIIGATLVALLAMLLSSFGLAWTIARPLRALSQAAEQVQRSLSRREELPDFTDRHDEIGHLSGTLRSMTDTLYRRIEASERFAADVAHELKNPLTSVRSAAETLGIVKSDAERKQFIETIQHDVKRLTRLIDDISKATRLEAEMALAEAEPVDLRDLLGTVVNVFNDVHVKHQQKVVLEIDETDAGPQDYIVNGFDIRLGQVFTNLLDNALSFSPEAGRVWVRARRLADDILIEIDDEGPGIPPGNLERIFARFYTDRPVASFGKNSGLGLSICKEIVTAHRGQIWAENRMRTAEPASRTPQSSNPVVVNAVLGARFSVRLPAAHPSATRTPRYIGRWK